MSADSPLTDAEFSDLVLRLARRVDEKRVEALRFRRDAWRDAVLRRIDDIKRGERHLQALPEYRVGLVDEFVGWLAENPCPTEGETT